MATASQVIGRNMRRIRKMKGWSAADLAVRLAELGMSLHSTAVTNTEIGKRKVSADDLMVFAFALDVTPAALLTLGFSGGLQVAPSVQIGAQQAQRWISGECPLAPELSFGRELTEEEGQQRAVWLAIEAALLGRGTAP